jgi:hypothetical protein
MSDHAAFVAAGRQATGKFVGHGIVAAVER